MILLVLMLAIAAVQLLFGLSPQPWREGHRKQAQVLNIASMAGVTACLFTTGELMFLSIGMAALTLFMAVFVVSGWVKRSSVSGRSS
jgi:hypothetical protein